MNTFTPNPNSYPSSTEISNALKSATSYRDNNFLNFLEKASTPIVVACPQGNILYANKSACELFEFSLEKMQTFNWENFISCAQFKFAEKIKKWHSKDENIVPENLPYSSDKEYKAMVLTDNEDTIITVSMFQNPLEVKLLQSELSLLMNNSEEAFLLLNKNLQIVCFNRKTASLFQAYIEKDLIKGNSILEYATPDRIDYLTKLYSRILSGATEKNKLSFNNINGDFISFNIKYQPAHDEAGLVIGVFISFKNTSKEELHFKALQQTQESLRKIMDYSLDIICTLNAAGFYVQISAAAERIWGYKIDEIIGKHYTEFITPDSIEPTYDTEIYLKSGKELRNFENSIYTKDGAVVFMEWSANWDDKVELMYCVGRNITDKKEADLKILQSEQRFKSLVQDGSDLVGILDEGGNYIYVSPTSIQVLGYKPEELVNNNAFGFIHPEDIERLKENFASINTHTKIKIAPFRFRHHSGEYRWIETLLTNLMDEPSVKGYVVNSKDITERIKAEEAIQFSAKLLDTIGQSAIATKLDGTITYWNKAAEIIYGYGAEEAIGENIMDLTPAPDSFEKSATIMDKLKKGESWSGEFLVKRKDGTIFPAAITNTPVLDQHGKVCGIIGISSDITERKIAERELELANERHSLVLKATNEVVWDWDMETNMVIRSADNMKILFGYDVNDNINDAGFWKSNLHPDEEKEVNAKFYNFINDPKQYYVDCAYRFKTANGSYADVHDKGFAIRNKEGKAVRMIGSVRDVSDLKREEVKLKLINEELKQQAKELEFSNRELEQFAYVASHDIQEPLRMVSSFLMQIEKKYEPLLDEKGKRYIHFAVDGAKRMRQIILDLLEYSRAGNKDDLQEEVNLEMILKEVKALLRRKIERQKAQIFSEPLPTLKSHFSPMRQVFQNLISNALLYSREAVAPEIYIRVKDRGAYWEFEIEDNGIGISEQFFDKIFIIFQRLHSKDHLEGSGVGLAITKKIIENYGGKIWLESKEGKGSSFYFTILK